jgi:hypothetical protein
MLVHATRDFVLPLFVALDEFVVHGLREEIRCVGAHDGWGGGTACRGVEEGAARWWGTGCAVGGVHFESLWDFGC